MAQKSEVQVLLEARIEETIFSRSIDLSDRLLSGGIKDYQIKQREEKALQLELDLQNALFQNSMLTSELLLSNSVLANKAEIGALVSSDNATDLASAMALVNELKTVVNGMNSF